MPCWIHCYNNDHPRGRKYRSEELRLHRQQWLDICKNNPEALVGAIRNADVGPLQALIDELEFNETVAGEEGSRNLFICRFHDQQFLRAIQNGAISLLHESTKSKIFDAYYAVGHANGEMEKVIHHVNIEQAINGSKIAIQRARSLIRIAKQELLTFLSHASYPESTVSAIDEGT